jgi:hypothetical protein
MNNGGKEKTSIKIAKVVLTMCHKQTGDPIKLYCTECEEGTCPTSCGDNTTIQEDPKADATDNDEVTPHAEDQEVQLEELSGATNGMTQPLNKKNSAEVNSSQIQPLNMENSAKVNSSQISKVIWTSRRQKKTLTTR